MTSTSVRQPRRTLLLGAAALAAPKVVWAVANANPVPPMTEGPFYPQPAWRARGPFAGDWDADLTRVARGGRERVAEGEHLGLELLVRDSKGRALDGVVVERSSAPGRLYVNGRGYRPDAPLAIRPETREVQHLGGRNFRLLVDWRAEEPAPKDLAVPQSASTSPASIALSKELKRRGWQFVGPTTIYSFMQSMGLVNDHYAGCHVIDECETARVETLSREG